MTRPLRLILLPELFAVCRLRPEVALPSWATAGNLYSITCTVDELSILCRQDLVPEAVKAEPGWRCLRVAGVLPFSAVGILASLVLPLAEAGVSVFAISTFDTDYLLVKEADLGEACEALRRAGHLPPA